MVRIRRFEERCAELYGQQKIRGFLHLYIGEEAVAVGALHALGPTTTSSPPTASTATRWCAGCRRARSWPRCTASRRAARAAAAARCTCSTRATRLYGGNAIVGGGLPLAVGLALADRMQRRRARHRLLLRRRRGRRGRVPRVDEPGGAVEAAGAVLLREQPLRDGHRARALRVADRPVRQGGLLRHAGDRASTAWTWSRCARRRRRRPSSCATAAARSSSSSAPTASARTRCTTPSSTATRPRSRSGRSATRSTASPRGCKAQGTLTEAEFVAIDAAAQAEVDAAVAFAEAGHLGAGRGPRARRAHAAGGSRREPHDHLPRGAARGAARRAARRSRASS